MADESQLMVTGADKINIVFKIMVLGGLPLSVVVATLQGTLP